MPNTTFPNIDFAFHRGTRKGLDASPIENGVFNICKDTRQLFIDIDDQRIEISDFVSNLKEEEILALENPLDKLYLSNDTFILYHYDSVSKTWKTVGGGGGDNNREYIDSRLANYDCGDEG